METLVTLKRDAVRAGSGPPGGYDRRMPSLQTSLPDLYERESATLYRLALRITGSREDARDLVQETFVKLLRDPPRDLRRPEAWVRTILTRAAIDRCRARARERERLREAELDGLPAGGEVSDDPLPGLERAEARARLQSGLAQLSALDRTLVLTRAAEDLPLEELAERVQLTEKAVRNRLSRARAFLKAHLEKE